MQSLFWSFLRIVVFISAIVFLINATVYEFEGTDEVQYENGLSGIFKTGYILQDTNQDGLIDHVNLFIVLNDNPSSSEIVSGGNAAARLGFETTSIDLNLSRFYSELDRVTGRPVLMIGNFSNLIHPEDYYYQQLNNLTPGQGVLRWIKSTSEFPLGGFQITGADASGILAAGEYFGGRFPQIWDPAKNVTLEDLINKHEEFLRNSGFENTKISVEHLVVERNRHGIRSAGLKITTDDESILEEIEKGIREELKEGRIDEESSLYFNQINRFDYVIKSNDEHLTISVPVSSSRYKQADNEATLNHSPDFNLSEIYTLNGLYTDTKGDFVPDDILGYISYSGQDNPKEVISLASRIALESSGLRMPLVRIAGRNDDPESYGFPILVGTQHSYGEILEKEGDLYEIDTISGEGFIQFIQNGFNDRNGIYIGGQDKTGLGAVLSYASGRLPYLWNYGKGQYQLKDLEEDVRRFFQGVNGPAQVVAGIEKLDTWLNRIEGDIEDVKVEIAAEEIPEGLEDFITELVSEFSSMANIEVASYPTKFGVGKTIFEESVEFPWEVDKAWGLIEARVIPNVSSGDQLNLDLRLSEPKEVRRDLEERINEEFLRLGINGEVSVLSAFKQGYSWLEEQVLPELKSKEIGKIDIVFHSIEDSNDVRWQAVHSDTRWLQELYPVDLVMARELSIPDSVIQFHSTLEKYPYYRVYAYDHNDNLVFEDTFDPAYTIRPFFDQFPQYDSVRVATGRLMAELNGEVLIDERIKTDLELFWDHFQNETYGKIVEYMMDVMEGEPSPDLAPFFDELNVNLWMSEPNYRIGIDEHTVSSLDGIHSDIYWQTLNLFSLIGNRYQVGPLHFAGRVKPYIHDAQGKGARADISFTGKERARPMLKLSYRLVGETEPITQKYELANLNVDIPHLGGIWVQSGQEGISRILFNVQAETELDRYQEFNKRATENSIDRAYTSVERLERMIQFLNRMHQQDMFEQTLSLEKLNELVIRFTAKDDENFEQYVSLFQTSNPAPASYPRLPEVEFDSSDAPIVQWETPISPDENNRLIAKLNQFPEVNAYYMADSFLGHHIFAADVLPSFASQYVSQAKLNALKPTLFLSAREHGNEVSSTSYVLRLLEYIATDKEYRKYLDRVNLVVQPMKNPDGAGLAYEMYQLNKDFTNHAGYVGALGINIRNALDRNRLDPIYPEAKVRQALRETWLPDIYMNLHGYPKNEWVQNFAGYSAWVRNRNVTSRSWWGYRGWFMPGYGWIDDPEYPDYKTASLGVLNAVTQSIRDSEEMHQANQRAYKTYTKYRSHDKSFVEHYVNDVLVYKSIKGSKLNDNGITGPKITYVSHTTESPDETAYGDWLKMINEAGIAHTEAALRYLYDGQNRIEETHTEDGGYLIKKRYRVKPVIPFEEEE